MKTSGIKKHSWLRALLFAVLLGGDQLTKHLAATNLRGQPPFVVIPNVLEFTYWENTGAAFSSFQGMNTILIVATLALMAVIGLALFRIPKQRKWLPLQYAIVVLLAGGLGNIVDRIFRGFVVDFIYFTPINFPKFNLADSYIVLAIIALLALVLFRYKDNEVFDIFKRTKKEG